MKMLIFLILIVTIALSCTHKTNVKPGIAGKVSGAWYWTNGKYEFKIAATPPGSRDYYIDLNDTIVTIVYISDTTIYAWGTKMFYNVNCKCFGGYFKSITISGDTLFFNYYHPISAAASEWTSYRAVMH